MAKSTSRVHKLFGLRIKALRTEKGITQEDLAFKIGVDRSYMGFVERGEHSPTLAKIVKITKALDVSLSDLFKSI